MEAQDDADRRLTENVAAEAVQAAPVHAKKVKKAAADAVRAAPDKMKGKAAADAVRAAPDEMKGKVAAAVVRAAPEKMKGEVAAAAVQAVPDEMKARVAAAAVQAAPDDLEGDVTAAAVQSVVNSQESERNDLRKVVSESIEASMAVALRRPVVTNVKGSMSLTLLRLSPERSQLDVKVSTGTDAWQTASLKGDTPFQLSGGEDRPSAPFEVAVDAPGLEVTPRQEDAEVPTTGASKSWTFMINGPWASDVIIWVTLFSSGRYIQAIQLNLDEAVHHDER